MKINKNDVLEGYTLSVNGPPDEWEEWCNSRLPVVLASLVDVPNGVYTLWELPQNPEGYPATPELDRRLLLQQDRNVASDFLVWIQDEGMHLCRTSEDEEDPQLYYPIKIALELLLDMYFDVDSGVVEKERRSILEFLHTKYQNAEAPKCSLKITTKDSEEEITID